MHEPSLLHGGMSQAPPAPLPASQAWSLYGSRLRFLPDTGARSRASEQQYAQGGAKLTCLQRLWNRRPGNRPRDSWRARVGVAKIARRVSTIVTCLMVIHVFPCRCVFRGGVGRERGWEEVWRELRFTWQPALTRPGSCGGHTYALKSWACVCACAERARWDPMTPSSCFFLTLIRSSLGPHGRGGVGGGGGERGPGRWPSE